ncbi:hypothetical protein MtrunA17_Chr4g0030521 [Medicago truncatula]|uniref:Transmembrane protein, putative n=1 Tax=Medicago truncatula TaxID=3880 RepID=G7JSN0_MEDTR|nr:transmembrane protein, putative [Medicago truncatula]RHN60869.1 hypothetical protein MtrunA17_Chr4g0030521 [Medicago truncatula]
MGGAARPVLTSVGFWRRFPMVRLGVWVGLLSPPYWPVSGVLLCSSVSVPVAVCAGWGLLLGGFRERPLAALLVYLVQYCLFIYLYISLSLKKIIN